MMPNTWTLAGASFPKEWTLTSRDQQTQKVLPHFPQKPFGFGLRSAKCGHVQRKSYLLPIIITLKPRVE